MRCICEDPDVIGRIDPDRRLFIHHRLCQRQRSLLVRVILSQNEDDRSLILSICVDRKCPFAGSAPNLREVQVDQIFELRVVRKLRVVCEQRVVLRKAHTCCRPDRHQRDPHRLLPDINRNREGDILPFSDRCIFECNLLVVLQCQLPVPGPHPEFRHQVVYRKFIAGCIDHPQLDVKRSV